MNDESVQVRPLGLSDVLALMGIASRAFLEHARFPEMGANAVRYVREHPGWQWGAFENEKMLGFLLTEPRAEEKRIAIRLIATDPAARGKGVGGRLLAVLEDKARAEGFSALSVGTPFAGGFYEKYGFKCTQVNLKMLREIINVPAARPEGIEIDTLDPDVAGEIFALLEGDELRGKFLNAFFGNYRQNRGLGIRIRRGGETLGVVVGGVSDFYRDFAAAKFFHVFTGGPEPLVRAFEHTVSTLGLRYVGFALAENEEETFKALGYARAERDFFWTMYTLKKAPCRG